MGGGRRHRVNPVTANPTARFAKPAAVTERCSRRRLASSTDAGNSEATVQDVADLPRHCSRAVSTTTSAARRSCSTGSRSRSTTDVDGLLAEAAGLPEVSALVRLQQFVRHQVAYNVRNLEAISVYYHDVDHLSKGPRKEIIDRRRTQDAVILTLIEEAQRAGDIRPCSRPLRPLPVRLRDRDLDLPLVPGPSSGIDTNALCETCVQFVTAGIAVV